MKSIYGLIVLAVLFACNSEIDKDAIRKEISELKAERSGLTESIDSLQYILDGLDTIKKSEAIIVNAKEMTKEPFYSKVKVSGTVEAVNDALISPEMNGQVKKIHVKEGQTVKAGTVLVTLNTSIIDNSIAEMKTRLNLATDVFNKQKSLWEKKIGSEIQYLQAKNNKEALEQSLKAMQAQRNLSIVKAPFDGIIDEIFAKEGEMASPGFRLIQLINLSELYVNADLSEHFLPKVKAGDMVNVTFPNLPGLSYDLPINRIGNFINPDNRTFKIQLSLKNVNNIIKPNLVASVEVTDFKIDTAFVLPSMIIKSDNRNRKFVFKIEEKDSKQFAKKIFVDEIISYNTNSYIEGIRVGDKIILKGDVKDGTEVVIPSEKTEEKIEVVSDSTKVIDKQ